MTVLQAAPELLQATSKALAAATHGAASDSAAASQQLQQHVGFLQPGQQQSQHTQQLQNAAAAQRLALTVRQRVVEELLLAAVHALHARTDTHERHAFRCCIGFCCCTLSLPGCCMAGGAVAAAAAHGDII